MTDTTMTDGRTLTWRAALVAVALLFAPWLMASGDPVGEVIFVTGEATVERDGHLLPLQRGQPVHAADRLATASDAHLHVRFVDGGLISLRPESRALVDVYRYDTARPGASQVRIELLEGVLRSATGKAGEANRDGFRINTPIAAIGIRGTDFVIYADQELVRLAVNAGGVVMAPFSDDCLVASFLPCGGDASAELFASVGKALLEVRVGQDFALVTTEGPLPDDIRPPHPQEASLFKAFMSTLRRNQSLYGEGLSAPGADSYEDGLEQARRYVREVSLVQEAFALGELESSRPIPRDRGLVEDPHFVWGRWSPAQRNIPEEIPFGVKFPGRDLVRQNIYFGLLEQRIDHRPLPDVGKVSFKLNSYDAFIARGASLGGTTLEMASITNPALVVDFAQHTFATRLDVHAASLPGPVHVLGAGQLTLNEHGIAIGSFNSDGRSLAVIEGMLSPNAEEAAYLFQYQISPGVRAIGATHWVNGELLGENMLQSLRY